MPVSRITTWNALDILTASALNGEFNQVFNNCASLTGTENLSNKSLASPVLTTPAIKGAGAGNATVQNANTATARTYTIPDIGATATLGVTQYGSGNLDNIPGQVTNLEMNLASGTLTFRGMGGTALSATNPATVIGKNATGGFSKMQFTANITWDDDAHATDSDFLGTGTGSWGTTAAVAWGDTMPFLVNAGTDGTTPVLFLSRGPVLTTGASTNIGYRENAPSSAAQNNVWALTTTNVTSSHANIPLTPIGSLRMTKSSADDWTFQAFDSGDGIMNFYTFDGRRYTTPLGQNGNTASKYGLNNGGTFATFTATNNNFYTIGMDGFCDWMVFLDNAAGGTAGAGSVNVILASPVGRANDNYEVGLGAGFSVGTGVSSIIMLRRDLTSAYTWSPVIQTTIVTVAAPMQNSTFSAVTRQLIFSNRFKAF